MKTDEKIFIIAEAGVNHNGSLDLAKEMIHAVAQAGADAVKFQTFLASNLVIRTAPKAGYQLKTTDCQESQYQMLKKLELNLDTHQILMRECEKCSIEFLSTPFDSDSLRLLVDECALKTIKIPSGEITNAPFILEIAQTNRPVILSTGMSTLGEIENALGVLAFGYLQKKECPSLKSFQLSFSSPEGQALLRSKVTLLHCTTEYPAPFDDINLKCMDTMAQAFQLPVGYSDHTEGIAIALAAAARGACVIEKHFTLDKNLSGPDHKASLAPNELKEMVHGIRCIERAMGNGVKAPFPSELKNRMIARKSLVAATSIEKGSVFSEKNLTAKRPGDGISPMNYWDLLNRESTKSYQIDEKILSI